MSILLNTLVPSTMVLEADVAWSFESLLREVTDELSNTPKTVISSTITAVLSSLDNGNNLSITAGSKQPSILPNGKQPNNNGNAMSPSLNKLRGEKKKM